MATATQLIHVLAESLGKGPKAVEAYALELSAVGWWGKAKRGRGAKPRSDMDAAKLVLALLSGGPTEIRGFFLTYANACVMPAMANDPMILAVKGALGLDGRAKFLDFIAAIVALYKDGRTSDLIYHSPYEDGQVEEWVYGGPHVDVRVKGPFPIATISFHLALPFIDKLTAAGHDREKLMGPQTIVFLREIYGWREAARINGDSLAGYDGAITEFRKLSAKGIGFERFIGGREISAIASALRGDAETDGGANE